MLFAALLVALGASSAAASAIEKRYIDYSNPDCPEGIGNIYLCDSHDWGNGDSSKCNVIGTPLDNNCYQLDSKFSNALGSFGPDPDIYCEVFWDSDPTCSGQIVWGGTTPGVSDFYDVGYWGYSPEGYEPGHSIKYYRCRHT